MTGSNNDEEIAGESPYHSSQHGQILTEIESTQQDVESQQIGKDIPDILRQPQVIGTLCLLQRLAAAIRRGQLIGGHAAKQGIGPTRGLSSTLMIHITLMTSTTTCR